MAKNVIAVLVLVGLAVAAYFVFRESPEDAQEKKKVEMTLEAIPRDTIQSVEIIRHEGTGPTLREEVIVLERAGDTWRMQKPVEYPVNTTSVERVLEALEALRTIDIISEKAERHHVLEVDDELGIEVTVKGDKDATLANFIVGVSRKNMTMVRIPGSEIVYRAQGSFRTTFNKSAKNIRDRSVTSLERGTVTRVKMKSERGELELKKVGEQPADREGMAPIPLFEPVGGAEIQNFNARLAAGTANSLTGLTAKDFVDEPLADDVTGLGEAATVVEFDATTRDGKKGTFTFWIGSDIEKSRLTYVKTSLSEQVFLVSSHLVMRYRAVADDFARTDEQVVQEEKQREAAAAHARDHEQRAEMQKAMQQAGPQGPGAPGPGGQISPEMMEKIRAQMEKKAPPKGEHDGHAH